MADQAVSALTELTAPAGEDLLYAVDTSSSSPKRRKLTLDTLLSNFQKSTANQAVLGATGYSLTGSDATSAIDIAGTWNTTGTPTGIKFNVTDTASNAASLLINLQVGGSSRFSVSKGGAGVFSSSVTASGFSTTGNITQNQTNSAGLRLGNSGAINGLLAGPDAIVGWCSSAPSGGAMDVALARDAANTLALRNSTAAQTFNVYNTWTDASNNERFEIRWSSNQCLIGTTASGTGTNRALLFVSGGQINMTPSGALYLGANSNPSFYITNSGRHFRAYNDDTYDFGQVSGERIRHLYVASSITPGKGVTVANLPTPSVGMVARVTDASSPTIGATVTGGGAAYALVNYNGSNWTVIGV